ncbi:MAG: hypothetical protein WCA32_04990 [Chromatiaceae bacterium]
MASQRPPGPINELTTEPVVIDDGTLARGRTAVPGPVGLDNKGGTSAKAGDRSLGDQVVSYASSRLGQRVGNGECFDLADRALRAAGARSAADYGPVTADADYRWGTPVTVGDAARGDIIQFRDYAFEKRTDRPDGWQEESQERPHHTAIVLSNDGNGAITVLEQNAPEGSAVHRIQLYFESGQTQEGDTSITVTVSGQFWIYRPEPRS